MGDHWLSKTELMARRPEPTSGSHTGEYGQRIDCQMNLSGLKEARILKGSKLPL